MSTCAHERYLAPGRTLCATCVQRLDDQIRTCGSLLDDLVVTAHRLDQTAPTGKIGSRSPKTTVPLPFRAEASALEDEMRSFLYSARTRTPGEWGGHPDGPQVLYRAIELAAAATLLVDLPEDLIALGACGYGGCEQRLYARHHQSSVVCSRCGAYHHIETRVSRRVREAWTHFAPRTTIAKALGIPVHSIDNWARRGRLTKISSDVAGRPLYCVGEVYNVAKQMAARTASE